MILVDQPKRFQMAYDRQSAEILPPGSQEGRRDSATGNHMEGELEHDIGHLGFIVVISGIGDLGYIQL